VGPRASLDVVVKREKPIIAPIGKYREHSHSNLASPKFALFIYLQQSAAVQQT